MGVGVWVGVEVGVLVGVSVGIKVAVAVGSGVFVGTGSNVEVLVGISTTAVDAGPLSPPQLFVQPARLDKINITIIPFRRKLRNIMTSVNLLNQEI